MKSAYCPSGAVAGLRARIAPPRPLILPQHVQRILKLLAIIVGFACGCRLGFTWASGNGWQVNAIGAIVGKCVPLIAGLLVLCRRPVRRGYEDCPRRT